jgi:hypothetical protein
MIHFMPVFSDPTYSESRLLPFGSKSDAEWIEHYDYESDSDLGYFSDDEHSGTEVDTSVLHQNGQASICSGERAGSVVPVKDIAYITLVLLNSLFLTLWK